ncbi:SDR family NAD(P)-dependent oxidoreductase [Rhodococcus opacus]|uniref:NAD-dependent epimerase/dehydratase family protein n=1 Tax=Rhodococcus opacus (strain B4) TaxID=632772 RepID=C1AYK7_RHOOB|nr:SDR family NAD(P)-dependent oxidoreductase [Rhodococcus opacus]BAH54202.1 NAD-dependent epimerase/dehydratase family protein [Rhodococcus opacus B4]
MLVLVTGGTGFVGAWSAKAAVDAGHRVRFLVRDPARLVTSAAALGLDTSDHVVGDITDAASVRRALDGCDAVIHAAAVVAVDPRRAEEMLQTNLAGAQNVLGTAVELGLDPIVYVSSIAALFQPGARLLTPDLPVCGPSDAYGRSKARVEQYARDLQADGAPIAITYPGMIVGPPAGNQFGEAAQAVEAAVHLRGLPGRGAAWTMVDVREVATAHAALLRQGSGARRFMLGGPRIPIAGIAGMLATITGRRMGVYPVPDSALRLVGRLVDVIDRFVSIDTPVSEAAMEYYTRMPDTDDSPSESELGVKYRDSVETLADTVAGLIEAGRL